MLMTLLKCFVKQVTILIIVWWIYMYIRFLVCRLILHQCMYLLICTVIEFSFIHYKQMLMCISLTLLSTCQITNIF